MILLATTQPAELPTDALLARLRYRRATILISGEQPLAETLEDIIDWVYQRLNKSLRRRLGPFLEILAMRHMVLALRYRLVEDMPPEALVRHALLAEPLKKLLFSSNDARWLIAKLEDALVQDYPFVSGLAKNFHQQGPGGVEQQLAGGILEHANDHADTPDCRSVLRYLIDMRNLLVIRKFWRWQVRQTPAFVSGGSFPPDVLGRTWSLHDETRHATMIRQLTGENAHDTQTISTEQVLLDGMTKHLGKLGRDPLGIGVIIEFFWRVQLAQHNHLLKRNLSVDRQDLLEEVLL
jgi:hypothetical protein